VITRSGFVLASYRGLRGAGTVRLVGSDAEANLALLQLSGGTEYPPVSIGGPLFNLSGQVLGLTVGYATHAGVGDGYVVPIDSALRLARQIAGQLCNSHPTARKIHQIKDLGLVNSRP
jgi:hypothetical protein